MREKERREEKKERDTQRQRERLSEQTVARKKRVKGKCNVALGCV